MNSPREKVRHAASGGAKPPQGVRPPAPPPARRIPNYEPFPVGALPDGLREFVEGVAGLLDCDPAFVALPALTLAGAAAGNAINARVNATWTQPPLLWTCCVADSGTGKSPSLKPITDIAFAVNKRLKSEFAAALERYKAEHAAWKNGENPDPEAEPRKPARAFFAVIDATIEKLIAVAGDSPRGLVMARDEMSGWFHSFARYKGGGGSDVSNWLSLYDAGPTSYLRRTGEPREVECDQTFAAVCGGIQPGILRGHLSDPAHVASGLAARIDFAMPPKKCLRWVEGELPEGVRERFGQVVAALTRLPFDPRNGPTFVNLDLNARSILKRLKNEFAERGEELDGGPLAPVYSKADGKALRLALIHFTVTEVAAGRDPGKGCINNASMAAGEELARWFLSEAARVYGMLAETPAETDLRSLAALVARKGGSVTPRDLTRANARRFPTADDAHEALRTLETAGYGRIENVPPGPGGGRPTVRFTLVTSPDETPRDRRNPPNDEGGGDGE